MSAQKIRAALGQLQDDPDREDSWNEVFEAVTAPDGGMPQAELRALLESARRGHETRREWDAVAKLLELEAGLHAGTPVEFAMQFELARVFEDELFDDKGATATYQRLLEIRRELIRNRGNRHHESTTFSPVRQEVYIASTTSSAASMSSAAVDI